MAKKSKFYEEIKGATLERQVEDVYMKGLKTYFNGEVTFPYGCDGYLEEGEENTLRLLAEFKYDYDLNSSMERAKVLIQVIFYLKRFENEGKKLPNVILVGDKNECFLLHTNDILKYLDYDLDWSIAPSTAHNKYIDTCIELSKEENLRSLYIHEINDKFSFKDIADKIKDMNNNIKRQVHITEHNLDMAFETFISRSHIDINAITPNNLVGVFVGCITNKTDYYLHPNKKNTLVTPYGEIKVKADGYKSYIDYFSRDYTAIEVRKFTEIADRLIEEVNRRKKGEFYTPKLFVDYAHKMIEKQLGADWKDDFIVWDCACGTKNLTKDYNFKELYCSTLEKSELEMSAKYNPNSTSFQFDFLNDSLDNLPKGLLNAFEQNKPIVFFINPPYATANNLDKDGTSKEGVAKTMINKQMLNDKIGACSQNLYAQFLYRILMIKNKYNLTNLHIALFSPTLYLSGTSWKGFRNAWLNGFSFTDGCVFKASHFADCADNWGIAFSFWANGVCEDKENFIHTLIDVEDNHIVEIGKKTIYNVDYSTTASDWIKSEVKKNNTYDAPQLSSGIKVKQNGRGRLCENALGYFVNVSNNVYKNITDVFMLSCTSSMGNGISVCKENFEKVNTSFASRKLIVGNWVNSKDEYIAPNEEHPQWKQFVADSVVYSLFHSASNQSSLRQIDYKGSKWDIKNEFFFMPKERMAELANECGNSYLYSDCATSNDRFVYKWLTEHKDELSDTAKDVLAKAIELTEKSVAYRELFNNDHEEYQINNWDCGWYQIKAMLKEYMPNEYKEFNELYKKLADEMRPMVYELGFLK